MYPYIEIFNRTIPTYGLLAVVGIIACFLAMIPITRKCKIKYDDVAYVFVFAMFGLCIGGKLLGWIIEIPWLVSTIISEGVSLNCFLAFAIKGNFVFYGGLIGAIAGAEISCKYFKLPREIHINSCTPLIPLFHGFGRIGCFLTGCCYGMESQRFGVCYTNAAGGAPNGVPLLPVQLIEAGFEFILFAVILIFAMKGKKHILSMYIYSYAVFRFVIEFFRGDTIRGLFFGLSTSQWVSIILVIAFTIYHIVRLTRKTKVNL